MTTSGSLLNLKIKNEFNSLLIFFKTWLYFIKKYAISFMIYRTLEKVLSVTKYIGKGIDLCSFVRE